MILIIRSLRALEFVVLIILLRSTELRADVYEGYIYEVYGEEVPLYKWIEIPIDEEGFFNHDGFKMRIKGRTVPEYLNVYVEGFEDEETPHTWCASLCTWYDEVEYIGFWNKKCLYGFKWIGQYGYWKAYWANLAGYSIRIIEEVQNIFQEISAFNNNKSGGAVIKWDCCLDPEEQITMIIDWRTYEEPVRIKIIELASNGQINEIWRCSVQKSKILELIDIGSNEYFKFVVFPQSNYITVFGNKSLNIKSNLLYSREVMYRHVNCVLRRFPEQKCIII